MRGLLRAAFRPLDAVMNRLAGWKYNPLYQSGTIAVALFVVLLVTGLYLVLFYRIGDPHGSIVRLTGQPVAGRWIRSLHRYASDAALVAILVHAVRMYFQGRSWGPRALAWVSGLALLGVFLIAGWTGFVMVWDDHGRWLAMEGARLLDVLPIFSEPLVRSFVGERSIPGAFFFVNLFAHVVLPVGVALVLWIHVSRLARPRLLPPRGLWVGCVGLLLAASILVPVGAGSVADPFAVAPSDSLNLFYTFWLPLAPLVHPGLALVTLTAIALGLLMVPIWTRPAPENRPPPSWVDPAFCTGCEQCFQDCPYEAITMVEGGRTGWLGEVDPALCVSCGICAGSCAPMGVGPPGRTGRDQLADVKAFLRDVPPDHDGILVVACSQSAGKAIRSEPARSGSGPSILYPVGCAGNLHSSVVEYLVRGGWGGVMVLACPPRDCWNREGPVWLEERMYHDREAELRSRVDRERVAIVHASEGETKPALDALRSFRARIGALEEPRAEADPVIDEECEVEPEGGSLVREGTE